MSGHDRAAVAFDAWKTATWMQAPNLEAVRIMLATADAHDAEHGTYRVSEDLLRAYDELYEHALMTVRPRDARGFELLMTVSAASRPWRVR